MLHIEDDIKVAKLPKNTVTLRVSKINTEFSYSKRVELKLLEKNSWDVSGLDQLTSSF